MHSIILCGFMGAGKTSVGKKLSKKLGMKFYDLDRFIEQEYGMPVSEIFARYGEAEFREIEKHAVEKTAAMEACVIACGGGTLMNEENVICFHRAGGRIVFLDTPLSVIKLRLENDTKRPLLQRPDRDRYIEALYQKRYPYYRMASDLIIPSAGYPPAVVLRLAKQIKALEVKEAGQTDTEKPKLPGKAEGKAERKDERRRYRRRRKRRHPPSQSG